MIDGYITVNEVAEKWDVNSRTVQVMCRDGRIEGAVKYGRDWAIPIDTVRPKDKRVSTGRYVGWRKTQSSDF